jgi:outer membrane protein TolC
MPLPHEFKSGGGQQPKDVKDDGAHGHRPHGSQTFIQRYSMKQAKRGKVTGPAGRQADFPTASLSCQPWPTSHRQGASRYLELTRALCIAAALLAATGCAVDEKKEVAQYKEILEGANAKGVSYTPGDLLPIQTAMLLANQNNEQLAINGEQYIQALINKDRATANFLPTLTLAPFYEGAQRAGGTNGGTASSITTGGVGAFGGVVNVAGNGSGAASGNSVSGVNNGASLSSTGSGPNSTLTGTTATGSTVGTTAAPALAHPTRGGSQAPAAAKAAASPGPMVAGVTQKKYVLDTPLQGKINLFNGFRDTGYYNFVISEIQRNRALLLDLQMQVMLDTATAYYTVLSNEGSANVLRGNVATQEENVRLIQGQEKAGVAKPADVAQAEAQLALTRSSLVTAESNVLNGRTLLAYLTAAPVRDAPLSDQLVVPDQLPSTEQLVQIADANRQDIGAAVAQVESARQAVQIAVGEYYPSISLSVNYYLSKQTAPTNNQWNFVIDAVQPIFDAGLIRADVRTALSQLRQAKLNESLTRRQVEEQVLTAFENLAASRARVKELQVAVRAAEEALRVAKGLYQFGNGLFLDILVAQDQLLSAQLSLDTEVFNLRIFYLTLLREVGRLGRPPGDLVTTTNPATQPIVPGLGPITLPGLNEMAPPTTLPLTPFTGPVEVPTTLPSSVPATGPASDTQPATQPLAPTTQTQPG